MNLNTILLSNYADLNFKEGPRREYVNCNHESWTLKKSPVWSFCWLLEYFTTSYYQDQNIQCGTSSEMLINNFELKINMFVI